VERRTAVFSEPQSGMSVSGRWWAAARPTPEDPSMSAVHHSMTCVFGCACACVCVCACVCQREREREREREIDRESESLCVCECLYVYVCMCVCL